MIWLSLEIFNVTGGNGKTARSGDPGDLAVSRADGPPQCFAVPHNAAIGARRGFIEAQNTLLECLRNKLFESFCQEFTTFAIG